MYVLQIVHIVHPDRPQVLAQYMMYQFECRLSAAHDTCISTCYKCDVIT